ncbi:MAG TPA: hypothetical protein VFB06_29425 [Streptosporangiaceae bacterium]|nr:hypothetical protein [Streptosporangiaceae bacterium]
MKRALAVLAALFFAVHVSVLGIPAPVPVLLVFAAVIGGLCRLIWIASGLRVYWRART